MQGRVIARRVRVFRDLVIWRPEGSVPESDATQLLAWVLSGEAR